MWWRTSSSNSAEVECQATAAWSILAPLWACRLQVAITCIKTRVSKKLYLISIATKPFPSLCPCLCCPNFSHRISHSGIMANASSPAHSFCWSVIHSLNAIKSVSLPWVTAVKVAHAGWTGVTQLPASASPHTFPSVCTNSKTDRYGLTEDRFLSGCCQQVVGCQQPDVLYIPADWVDAGRMWTTRDLSSSPCLCSCSQYLQIPDMSRNNFCYCFSPLGVPARTNRCCAQIQANKKIQCFFGKQTFKQSFQGT